MTIEETKLMLKYAREYASKQGDIEYQSSFEDFIEGYKKALTLNDVGSNEVAFKDKEIQKFEDYRDELYDKEFNIQP